jgi:hypothetical protein
MGLDMYLNGKRFLWHHEDAVAEEIKDRLPELKQQRVKEIVIEAGYWRKANAIHKWFVDNVQNGTDDCGGYRVDREDLTKLRDLCQQVLDFRHLATDKLPPAKGFFFGSNDINEWYFEDLKQTIEICNDALALPDSWEFEYHSSW